MHPCQVWIGPWYWETQALGVMSWLFLAPQKPECAPPSIPTWREIRSAHTTMLFDLPFPEWTRGDSSQIPGNAPDLCDIWVLAILTLSWCDPLSHALPLHQLGVPGTGSLGKRGDTFWALTLSQTSGTLPTLGPNLRGFHQTFPQEHWCKQVNNDNVPNQLTQHHMHCPLERGRSST